jgi:hypothetical protein
MTGEAFYRESGSYRIAVDDKGAGSIRILKRVNFRTFILLFREVYLEMKKKEPARNHIIFYVSRSLYDEMSGNTREFLDFCSTCMDTTFEMIIVE